MEPPSLAGLCRRTREDGTLSLLPAVRVHRARTLQARRKEPVERLGKPGKNPRLGARVFRLPGCGKDSRSKEKEKYVNDRDTRPDCAGHRASPGEAALAPLPSWEGGAALTVQRGRLQQVGRTQAQLNVILPTSGCTSAKRDAAAGHGAVARPWAWSCSDRRIPSGGSTRHSHRGTSASLIS
jgi:hypothetical protein